MSSPRPCSGSANRAWRTSCCALASSAPTLWPAGGRGDGGGDFTDHRPPLWHRPGLEVHGHPSMLTDSGPTPRRQSRRSVANRSRRCPTAPYWRRSAPIWPARPGTARAIARLGQAARDGRHPGRAQTGAAADARERPAVASRPHARRGAARPSHHHRGAEHHVDGVGQGPGGEVGGKPAEGTGAAQVATVQGGKVCSASSSTGAPKRWAGTLPSAATVTPPCRPSA